MDAINFTKNIIKKILGYKFNNIEYNHSYGNIIKYNKSLWDKNFIKTSNDINLQEAYRKFITDLDEESIEICSKTLCRLYLLSKFHSKKQNIFTEEECKAINNSYISMYSSIIKLSNNCYAYKSFFLPKNEFEVSTFIYKYGLNKINKSYLNNKSIIDAGAYIGDSCILFEHELKNITSIYGFEPAKNTYQSFLQTIQLNNSKKIIPVNLALGENETTLPLTGVGMGKTLSTANDTRFKSISEEVKVITLDNYVKQNNINVGLIKTDLEGFEKSFLRGSINTIKEYKPTLLISIYHNAHDYFEIKEFIKSLKLGYKFKLFKADDGYIVAGTLLICEV